jgi:hypothetical protein
MKRELGSEAKQWLGSEAETSTGRKLKYNKWEWPLPKQS